MSENYEKEIAALTAQRDELLRLFTWMDKYLLSITDQRGFGGALIIHWIDDEDDEQTTTSADLLEAVRAAREEEGTTCKRG